MFPKYGWLFRVLALVCLIGLIYLGSMAPGAGFRVSCVNGNCIAAASTSWVLSALAPVALGLIILLPRPLAAHLQASGKRAGYWRRFVALLLDYSLLGAVFAPLALIPLLLEWHATGEFSWSFYREFARPTDWATLPVVLALFAIIYFYYDRASRAGRQTVGQFILGYRVSLSHRNWRTPIGAAYGLFAYLGIMPRFMVRFVQRANRALGLGWINSTVDPILDAEYELVKIDVHRPHPSNGT